MTKKKKFSIFLRKWRFDVEKDVEAVHPDLAGRSYRYTTYTFPPRRGLDWVYVHVGHLWALMTKADAHDTWGDDTTQEEAEFYLREHLNQVVCFAAGEVFRVTVSRRNTAGDWKVLDSFSEEFGLPAVRTLISGVCIFLTSEEAARLDEFIEEIRQSLGWQDIE